MRCKAYGLALAVLLSAGLVQSAMMTEMTFRTAAANGSEASVPIDVFPEMASGELKLRGDGARTVEVLDAPTEIGGPWDARITFGVPAEATPGGSGWKEGIKRGFLHVDSYTHTANRDRVGVTSPDRMSHYLGRKSGTDIAGTAYFVFRPSSSWTPSHRRTLFGTGASTQAYLRLWLPHGDEEGNRLTFDWVRGAAPRAHCRTTVTTEWSEDAWYFAAVSWQRDHEPVLYLRRMSPDGPAASPAALTGTLTEGDGYQTTVPAGSNNHPFMQPLALGAYYYHDGGKGGTIDGAAAHIAYFRLDAGLASVEDIEAVFNGLAGD